MISCWSEGGVFRKETDPMVAVHRWLVAGAVAASLLVPASPSFAQDIVVDANGVVAPILVVVFHNTPVSGEAGAHNEEARSTRRTSHDGRDDR